MAETTAHTSLQIAAESGGTLRADSLLARIAMHNLTDENLNSVLGAFIGVIIDHFGADGGCVVLKDAEGALWRCAPEADANGEGGPAFIEAIVEHAMRTADIVVLDDAAADYPPKAAFQGGDVHSVLCAPIASGDAVLGAVYLSSAQTGLWSRPHADIAGFLAGHAALALDNLRMRKACEENKRLVAAGRATLNLSHSVKNILQMITGAAEVVDFGLRTNQIHRVKRSWDILKPNIDRMKKYTLEMLDYSKERPLNLGSCDFNRVVQGAVETLKSQLKVKCSRINIRIDQRIPAVALDGDRIHEMALNLILNAIDVVDSTEGLVSVETKYDPACRTIKLAVTDNGPGISDAMKEKIFTPFESGKKKLGTGLGMAIAKQIVEQHHGEIVVDTQLLRGTTFTVSLPADMPPAV
ncbi:MAG: GAF domain-containing sensor histidine kinase [Phycisphaerae bacterium]|nr:GAF domain-containing sensor histidine kinase [Phycisphaerae bacterium]